MTERSNSSRKDTVRIYVLWHPDYQEGQEYAKAVFSWFYMPIDPIHQGGLDIPVLYRSKSYLQQSIPKQLDLEEAELNLIVVLAEEHMVSDHAWRKYLTQYAEAANPKQSQSSASPSIHTVLFPVAMDKYAYNLPGSITELNFIRVDRKEDNLDVSAEEKFERRKDRLIYQLTEVGSRLLLAKNKRMSLREFEEQPPSIQIFLSHAKADGASIAESIRDYIYQNTQLRAFYDENDLTLGVGFSESLKVAGAESPAMVVVYTDHYPERPWCLKEIQLATQPRQKDIEHFWTISPLLIVDALGGGLTKCISAFGNAPAIRWKPGGEPIILNTLLREVFLRAYFVQQACDNALGNHGHVINWMPDLQTLMAMKKAAGEGVLKIMYPGLGLLNDEQKQMQQLLPGVEIETYREALMPESQKIKETMGDQGLKERLIALSISYTDEQLTLGYSREHISSLMLRIAQWISRQGGNLAYGGALWKEGFTQDLFRLFQRERQNSLSPSSGHIYNFLAWPHYDDLTSELEAEVVNFCSFVKITPEHVGLPQKIDSPQKGVNSPQVLYHKYKTLSYMRQSMQGGLVNGPDGEKTPPLFARVVLGGKTKGFSGLLPGIFEEALVAMEKQTPLYIIGAFGGAAHLLSTALIENVFPKEMNLDYHTQENSNFGTLLAGIQHYGKETPAKIYQKLKDYLQKGHTSLSNVLNNGLSDEENIKFMTTEDISLIMDLIAKGLQTKATRITKK